MARHSLRVSFPGGNGFPLAGIIDRPEPLGNAPIMVLSHCFTCSKDFKAIVRLSRMLADRDIAVLRYDMTGLGGSGGEFADTNFTTNCRDLTAAVQFAESELGDVTALMGHSFGGAASMAMAAAGTFANIAALVTLAAPSDTSHLADLLVAMDPAIESEGIGTVSIGGRRWTIKRQMIDDFRKHRLSDQLQAIKCQTLVMHSPVDATVRFEHAQSIVNSIGHDASLLSLGRADHLLSSDPADIKLVADVTAAFIDRHAAQSA